MTGCRPPRFGAAASRLIEAGPRATRCSPLVRRPASPAKPAAARLAAAPVKAQTGAPHASKPAAAVAQAAKSSPAPAKPSAVAAKAAAVPAKAQVAGKPHRGDRVAAIY
ncbi:hypothetical protein [Methylobacterium hispanicum]|uniref:hypothetical protein n=1 Tax=Methylobacterium hispanicum TaxID=270350 RepID=UPI002F350762